VDLIDRVADVDDRQLVGDQQPVRVDRGEVGQVVVERAGDGPPLVADQVEVPERAQLGVEHLHVDAVAVHLLEPGVRLVVPRAARPLEVEVLAESHLHPAAELAGRRGLDLQRFVVGPDERLRQSVADVVRADQYVRVH
jgi:hypothetical protein